MATKVYLTKCRENILAHISLVPVYTTITLWINSKRALFAPKTVVVGVEILLEVKTLERN